MQTQPRRTKVKGTTGIYLSRSGSYEVNYRADDGRLVWKTIGTNLAEAKAARAELVVAKRDGKLPSTSNATLQQVSDEWLAEMKSEWAVGTYSLRETNLRVHILPILGKVKCKDLGADHIWKVVLALREKKLERSTQRLILYGVLSSMLNWAVDAKHLNANPTQRLSRNRRKQLTVGEREDVKVVEDASALLAKTPASYLLLFKLALATGLRISELLGLRRRDIGETHVHVCGQLDRATRQWTERTKTGKAKRDVVLVSSLRAELLLALPAGIGEDDLIFTVEDGRGLLSSRVELIFKQSAKKAGLDESLTFHALRHTFASRLIEHGYPITLIQNALGHKTPDVTLKVYSHLFNKQGQEDKLRKTLDSFVDEMKTASI